MKRVTSGLIGLGLVASLGLVTAPAGVAETAPPTNAVDQVTGQDELPNPLEDKRRALREQAVTITQHRFGNHDPSFDRVLPR